MNTTSVSAPSSIFVVTGTSDWTSRNLAIALQIVVFSAGVLMALSSVMIFLLHSLKSATPRIQRRWRQRSPSYTFDKLRTGDGWIDPTLKGVLYSAVAEW